MNFQDAAGQLDMKELMRNMSDAQLLDLIKSSPEVQSLLCSSRRNTKDS